MTMIHPVTSEPADASSTAGSSCATVRWYKTCVQGQTYLGELLHCEQRAVGSAVRLAHANHYCADARPNGCSHCDHRKNFGSEGQHPNIGQRQFKLKRGVSAVQVALGKSLTSPSNTTGYHGFESNATAVMQPKNMMTNSATHTALGSSSCSNVYATYQNQCTERKCATGFAQ